MERLSELFGSAEPAVHGTEPGDPHSSCATETSESYRYTVVSYWCLCLWCSREVFVFYAVKDMLLYRVFCPLAPFFH